MNGNVPKNYTWDTVPKKWKRRKKISDDEIPEIISHLHSTHPIEVLLYALRLLLKISRNLQVLKILGQLKGRYTNNFKKLPLPEI